MIITLFIFYLVDTLSQGRPDCLQEYHGQQFNTIRPHTISNSTFENKTRTPLEKNTFIPPGREPNSSSIHHKQQDNSVKQQPNDRREKQQPIKVDHYSQNTKSDQLPGIEDERRYSTIRRSCRYLICEMSFGFE